jgi:hypothetical protein
MTFKLAFKLTRLASKRFFVFLMIKEIQREVAGATLPLPISIDNDNHYY